MSSEVAGGSGESPVTHKTGAKAVVMQFVKEFQGDDLAGMAAEIAYHLIFAIPPLIILVVMAAALVNQYSHLDVVSNLQQFVDKRAPADLASVLDSVVGNAVGKVGGGVASIGAALTAILALWSGSNGVSSFMKAFNRAYDVDEARPFIRKKLLALGLTLAMILVVIIAFALFVFGHQLGSWIANQVGLSNAFSTGWDVGRWPVAIFFVMVLLSALYYLGPNVDQRFRWVSLGSVVATLLWIAAVFGFKLYLDLSNPGSTYGAFGGLVVLLFFLYITSLVFLVGAELNAVLEHRFEHDLSESPASHIEVINDDALPREARVGNASGVAHLEASTTPDALASSQAGSGAAIGAGGDVEPPTQAPAPRERRDLSILLAGFTAAGVAGALGWLAGRRRPHQR